MDTQTWERINRLTEAQEARLNEIVLQHTRLAKEYSELLLLWIIDSSVGERLLDIKQALSTLEEERKMLIGE